MKNLCLLFVRPISGAACAEEIFFDEKKDRASASLPPCGFISANYQRDRFDYGSGSGLRAAGRQASLHRVGRKNRSDIEVGHRTASLCHLLNIGRELGRNLTWDAATETFPNDAEANALLDREPREGRNAAAYR